MLVKMWEQFMALLGSMRTSGPTQQLSTTKKNWTEIDAGLPAAEERLFDTRERLFSSEEPAVILWRDEAGWCPFCLATVLLLEEMKLSYRVKTIPLAGYLRPGQVKPAEYLAMVPDGVVPGLQHRSSDGFEPAFRNVYTIFDDLRRTYPERYPLGDPEKHDAICGVDGLAGKFERAPYRRDPEAAREPLEILETLIQGPFVCGTEMSAADCLLLPFLERIEAYTIYFHGQTQLQALPWFPKVATLLETARQNCNAYRHFGSDPQTLTRIVLRFSPQAPLSADALAIDTPDRNIQLSDAQEAAKKLASNHRNVAKFAARLADDDKLVDSIDDALLHVANGLASNDLDYSSVALADPLSVADALTVLSHNVGVPRDFLPGPANALRAHLTDLATALRPHHPSDASQ